MRIVLALLLSVAIIGGCGNEGILDANEPDTVELDADDVVQIAGSDGVEVRTAQWYVNRVGAQLIEARYRSYAEAGMGESDFDRMPDNELTTHLRRLYLDLEPLMQTE